MYKQEGENFHIQTTTRVMQWTKCPSLTLIVRVECHGPPVPVAIHAVSLEEVVQRGDESSGSLTQVDRVQLGDCL